MKKFIFCTSLVLISCQAFSQQTNEPARLPNREFYLEKVTKQKTTAWLFLIGGVVSAGVGLAIGASSVCFGCPNGAPDAGAAETLAIVGGVLSATSIPFFISAAKNKKKARNLSASLKLESNRFLPSTGYSKRSFPAVSFVFKL